MRQTICLCTWLSAVTMAGAQSPEDILNGVPMSPLPMVVPIKPPKEWSGGADFGVNGSDGNSQNFNLRMFGEAKRERLDSIWSGSLLYNYATAAALRTANQAILNSRYEWLYASSAWNTWVSGGLEYNQFRAFDLLLTTHAGVAYSWWKDVGGLLKTRGGFGGSQPIGGPNDSFIPEAMLGLDYERKVYDRTKFVFGGQLFPNLSDWFEFRAEVRAALEILIDPEHNLGVRLGVVDLYFSDPQGRKPNDIQYFASLMWRF